MWTSLYMAQSKEKALKIKNAIEKENIIVMLRPIRVSESAIEECYEILVPQPEFESALEVVIEER